MTDTTNQPGLRRFVSARMETKPGVGVRLRCRLEAFRFALSEFYKNLNAPCFATSTKPWQQLRLAEACLMVQERCQLCAEPSVCLAWERGKE